MRVPGQRGPAGAGSTRSRGIYLISTLLLLTFLVMLGGAIAVSFQQGLASSGSFNNRQMALSAALSGLQYLQARLESNSVLYGPIHAAPSSADYAVVSDRRLTVREDQDPASKSVNVCGFLTNDNAEIAGASEGKVYLMFRATFNGSYASFAAQPDDWGFVTKVAPNGAWSRTLGPMPYVSMNNLLRSSQLPGGTSYTAAGAAFKAVPSGTADVIVEGLVVSPDGTVLARRYVEAMYGLAGSQSPTSPGPATAAQNLNLTLYQPEAAGGVLNVGVANGADASFAENAGLAAYKGTITLNGLDTATSTTEPPAYASQAKASIRASSKFDYTWLDGSTVKRQSYTTTTAGQTVVQEKEVPPPAVKAEDLPAQVNPKSLAAGTWVVWNGELRHYATDYVSSQPVNSQQWGLDASGTLTLNGKSPDAETLPSGLVFDKATNTVTVPSDVAVSPTGGANGFAFVVAPSDTTPTNGINSAAAGSAQIVFDASSGSTPQLRSSGSVTVVGNVTGQGALVSTGVSDPTASARDGDVTVIGKSSLDPRSDSGVALYAAGSVTMEQLSWGQAPAAVPAVRDTMSSMGVVEGAGEASAATAATNFTSEKAAVYSALTQAMVAKSPDLQKKGFLTLNASTNTYKLAISSDYDFGSVVKDAHVSITYNGKTYAGGLNHVLDDIGKAARDDVLRSNLSLQPQRTSGALIDDNWWVPNVPSVPKMVGQGGFTFLGNQWIGLHKYPTYSIPASTFANYLSSGTSTAPPSASPAPATTPSNATTTAAVGVGASGVVPASLNQSFSGLVYAGKDLNIRNGLGGLTINGLAAAYGGDPRAQQPGEGQGGSINLSANNISLLYDPTTIGPYLYLFGGVKLKVVSLSNF